MTKQNARKAVRCILTGRITSQRSNSSHSYLRDLVVSGKQKFISGTNTFFIKSIFSTKLKYGAFSLYVATYFVCKYMSYLLVHQVHQKNPIFQGKGIFCCIFCFMGRIFHIFCDRLRKDVRVAWRIWFIIRVYITWSIYLRSCRQNDLLVVSEHDREEHDFLLEFILCAVFATGTVDKTHLLVISENEV